MEEEKQIIEVMNQGRALQDLTRSEAWSFARRILTDKIVDLQWIGNIKGNTPEERDRDAQAKQMAVDILYEFLEEVEGGATQFANNKEMLDNVKRDIYERRLEV